MTRHLFRLFLTVSAAAAMLSAQAPSIPYVPPPPPKPAQTPAPTITPPQANGAPLPGRLSETDAFSMDNVSLTEMIRVLAQRLKINYILDPRIKGAVTIHTYGE